MRAALGQRVDTSIFRSHLSELVDTRGSRKDPDRQASRFFPIRQRRHPGLGAGPDGAWPNGPDVAARSAGFSGKLCGSGGGGAPARASRRCRTRRSGRFSWSRTMPRPRGARPPPGRSSAAGEPARRKDWTVFLTPTSARGPGRGKTPFRAEAEAGDGPLAALTRATIRPPVASAVLEARTRHLGGDRFGPQRRVQDSASERCPGCTRVTFSIWPDRGIDESPSPAAAPRKARSARCARKAGSAKNSTPGSASRAAPEAGAGRTRFQHCRGAPHERLRTPAVSLQRHRRPGGHGAGDDPDGHRPRKSEAFSSSATGARESRSAVRALAALLPPIKVVEGCPVNSENPEECPDWAKIGSERRVKRPTPVIDLPLGAPRTG